MPLMLKIFLFLFLLVASFQGAFMFVRGKVRRRFAKGYDIFYEGILVRVLGLFSIFMGVYAVLVFFEMISGIMALILFFLIGLPGGVIGAIVQQNGVVIKK